MSESAHDEELLDEIASELASVEAVLSRLDDGSYGRCEACDANVDPTALAVDPLAARCPTHPASI